MREARSAFLRSIMRAIHHHTIAALIVQQRLLGIDVFVPWLDLKTLDQVYKDVFEQSIIESLNNTFPLKGLFK